MDFKRRTFLKIMGLGSLSLTAGCLSEPDNNLFSQVKAPNDRVTGMHTWYATTCRECPAGCGVLAKFRENRVVKLEGNPLHPVNRGTLCMRGQSALQGIYDPDRLTAPMLKENGQWKAIGFAQAMDLISQKAAQASAKGPGRVRMATEIVGESRLALFEQAMKKWQSPAPLVFEAFAYESQKAAAKTIFGQAMLPSLAMEDADFLVSFGADFLETWQSPVEYAWKFKAMHTGNHGHGGLFCHVGPYQSMTGANADYWLQVAPGGQTAVLLGLMNDALAAGKGQKLEPALREAAVKAASSFDANRVVTDSGIDADLYKKLSKRLLAARKPLILGTGVGTTGPEALRTDTAALLLNMVLDPDLSLFDFQNRRRVETASSRSEALDFFAPMAGRDVDLWLINNTNPAYASPAISDLLEKRVFSNFTVCFSGFMDDTASLADLVFPAKQPLESWDEYSDTGSSLSLLQPVMGQLTKSLDVGDVLLNPKIGVDPNAKNYKEFLVGRLIAQGHVQNEKDWAMAVRSGGVFKKTIGKTPASVGEAPAAVNEMFIAVSAPEQTGMVFTATPSIRYFDGRGANKPWLNEIPDPLTMVAWNNPVQVHPETMRKNGWVQEDIIEISTPYGKLSAPVYDSENVRPGVLAMDIGLGHNGFGRYAAQNGANPGLLLPLETDPATGGPMFMVSGATAQKAMGIKELAHTDGHRYQLDRRIAMKTKPGHHEEHHKPGLTLETFPLKLPLPESHSKETDIFPPHGHAGYRWGMIVDLDKCIGCSACAAACYAENNLAVVGEERMIQGREMAWLQVQRYLDDEHGEKIMFLPMMCQHCDNAPCESVCPVYAPHHGKEGLNNQIYNRCIGTRFCAQNCPYKVRRFNWFDWDRPEPLNLQLNPDVTVRSKGVMEKCSFCVQRIKYAHGVAKNENRKIKDGEILPACVQTCPTGALTFGDFMDKGNKVRQLAAGDRAYQILGYLNTKPAVIYLKKVEREL